MNLTYRKSPNSNLFTEFEDINLVNARQSQNYIPLYNNFFKLSDSNYNNINLNHKYSLNSITEKINENKYKGTIKNNESNNESNDIKDSTIFIKYAPLLDPFKFLAGKYDSCIFELPKLNSKSQFEKLDCPNNSAYIDSFFIYLSSQLLNYKNFLHGINFYGSFLGIKNEYIIDISDDLDMLFASKFFYENKHLYKFVNSEQESLLFNDKSRRYKKPIKFSTDCDVSLLDIEIIESNIPIVDIIPDINDRDTLIYNIESTDAKDEIEAIKAKGSTEIKDATNATEDSCSDISSRTSQSSKSSSNDSNSKDSEDSEDEHEGEGNSEDPGEDNGEDDNENNSYYSGSSGSSDEINDIMVSVKEFPVNIITIECCENTFDDLLVNDKIDNNELTCIILQILMILITYQKLFNFTHNDLHTNNIMYIKTEKKYLYYKYNDKHYKIPTYGKLFKIIDFGRAIYEYKGQVMYSDSFHKDGDAATQYNSPPFYNTNKPLIEPNMSFDLCRLGCSIYDFIIDKYDDTKNMSPIHKIIVDWCLDDEGKNMLYKNNNQERYPDFKLYKMIARKVHGHLPHKVLQQKLFNKFMVPKKEIKSGSLIMNIDTISLD